MQTLKIQYQDLNGRAERLRDAIVAQLGDLLAQHQVTLGVPIESRVKTWDSIEEKIQRKGIKLSEISDLQDLVGVRLIVLFRSDLDKTLKLIQQSFQIISQEDTAARLTESEFGYQSQHVVLKLPEAWLSVPSLSKLGDLFVELQIRTIAQHIWAAASHKLQYKNELGVPPPLRRTINRVSALLETVDLEFDRVLEERKQYIDESTTSDRENEPLNIEIVSSLLSELYPVENKKENEPYADLLDDIRQLGISTGAALRRILTDHMQASMKREIEQVSQHRSGREPNDEPDNAERIARGVFFAHVGLARQALRAEFGDDSVTKIFQARAGKKPRKKEA